MRPEVAHVGRVAASRKIFLGRIETHSDIEELAPYEIRLRRLLHANGKIRLTHRQVEDALLKHEVNLDVGMAPVECLKPRCQPECSEANCCGDPQFAENFLLRVPNVRNRKFQALRHCLRGVEQQFPLFGEEKAPGMAVEQCGRQAAFERLDLPADGRLMQIQRFSGSRQAADRRNGPENAQFVPVQFLPIALVSRVATPACTMRSMHSFCP